MALVMKMFFIVLILHSSIVHSPVKNGSNPEGKKKTYYKGEDARNNKVFEALDTAIRQELGSLFRQHSFQIKSSTTQAIDISLDGKGHRSMECSFLNRTDKNKNDASSKEVEVGPATMENYSEWMVVVRKARKVQIRKDADLEKPNKSGSQFDALREEISVPVKKESN
ncbi:hypothetical protein MANES_10G099401v8 [Manihot esculenta]|uniref:Uncharacterized protein n=1 Tax=Manihot esculenta TaxID=3983 RepID=A0ACB7GZN1_MANES|nr:hypothetical protein MANES_10G099401v8 [Manihot esculenta]